MWKLSKYISGDALKVCVNENGSRITQTYAKPKQFNHICTGPEGTL